MKALVAALLVASTLQAGAAEYKLTWTAGTMTPRGPWIGEIPEAQKFESEEACNKFVEVMGPRLRDWIRGRINADWDHLVGLNYKCEVEGRGT